MESTHIETNWHGIRVEALEHSRAATYWDEPIGDIEFHWEDLRVGDLREFLEAIEDGWLGIALAQAGFSLSFIRSRAERWGLLPEAAAEWIYNNHSDDIRDDLRRYGKTVA